jgi:hypothetical protein
MIITELQSGVFVGIALCFGIPVLLHILPFIIKFPSQRCRWFRRWRGGLWVKKDGWYSHGDEWRQVSATFWNYKPEPWCEYEDYRLYRDIL